MPKTVIVSATDLVRHFGDYARTALADPVQIAQHGQVRLALVNADLIERLPTGGNDDSARLGARFDILFDEIETLVAIVDSNVNIVRLNAAARRYHQISRDEAEGRPLHTLLSAPEVRSLPAAVLRVIASGQSEDFHLESKKFVGRTLHTRIIPFPGGAALLGDDVTDSMTAARHDATRAALISALDATGVGEGSINVRGVVEEASQALERLTGASADRLLNVRLPSLFAVRSREAVVSLVENALARGEGGAIDCELLTDRGPLAVRLSIEPVAALESGAHATFLVRAA